MAAEDEEAPERLLPGLLKPEHGADLKRGEQPQALGGRADLLVGAAPREQQPHLGLREVTPAPADLAEAVALPTLPDERVDEGGQGDDAGMIQIFSEAQSSPRNSRGDEVVTDPARRVARGPRAGRRAACPARVRRPACGWCTVLRASDEMLQEHAIGATSFDEAVGVPALRRLFDDTVRVGLEGPPAPRGPETGFPDEFERRGGELPAEEDPTGLEQLGVASGFHGAIIGEIVFEWHARLSELAARAGPRCPGCKRGRFSPAAW